MITFIESALIGCGYLVLGRLVDVFGAGQGFAWFALLPLAAGVLCIPALRRGRWVREESPATPR